MKQYIKLADILNAAKAVAEKIRTEVPNKQHLLYGIPRGGIPASLAVMGFLPDAKVVDDPSQASIFIDDLIDSGQTEQRYKNNFPGIPFYALFDKRLPWINSGTWLVFPWEMNGEEDESGHDIVIRLLQYIGEDPSRGGLKDTPARVVRAWKEWATGYDQDPAEVMKTFEDGAKGYDELVIVHNVPVISKCEHHLADIIGHAHIGYIPNGKIVGLSKLARLVDMFARRLQVQERMTNQIADVMVEHLNPIGAGVIIRATHACMSTRGVKVHGSVTTTSAMRGALLEKVAAREEFISLCRMAERDRS